MLSIAEKPVPGNRDGGHAPAASLIGVKLRRAPIPAAAPAAPAALAAPAAPAPIEEPVHAPPTELEPAAAATAYDDAGHASAAETEHRAWHPDPPVETPIPEPRLDDPWAPGPVPAAELEPAPVEPVPVEPVPDAFAAIRPSRSPDELIEYWAGQLSAQDRLPRQIDFDAVARDWRNVFLFSLIGSQRKPLVELVAKGRVDLPRLTSGGIGQDDGLFVWTIELARKAVATGRPIHKVMALQGEENAPLGLVVLPLAANGADVTHVLCHLHDTGAPSGTA